VTSIIVINSKDQFNYYLFIYLKLKVMSSKVVVLADATTKSVINLSNNPEFGFIRVEQSVNQYDDNGFLRRKKLSAIISGPISDLQDAGYYEGQLLDGKIIVQEAMEPFNGKNPERDLKVAGSTGIVCRVEGAPVYRRTLYTEKQNLTDSFIAHTNVEEIKAAYETTKSSAIKPNEEFGI
jgi:hypothetical protein